MKKRYHEKFSMKICAAEKRVFFSLNRSCKNMNSNVTLSTHFLHIHKQNITEFHHLAKSKHHSEMFDSCACLVMILDYLDQFN